MAVKKLAGLVTQSSKKVEGERCERVQLCHCPGVQRQALGRTGCTQEKLGGKEKQQQKKPRIRVFKCFCHRARGILVLVQFGAGSSEDSQVRGP